jgi:hypothetical protein
MEKGLSFPLLYGEHNFYYIDDYIGYNKFLSLLPKDIQLKFVK